MWKYTDRLNDSRGNSELQMVDEQGTGKLLVLFTRLFFFFFSVMNERSMQLLSLFYIISVLSQSIMRTLV